MNITPQVVKRAIPTISDWLHFQAYLWECPGLSAGIVIGDELIFSAGYGYANREKKIPAAVDTTYSIASISKTFTATAVMQMVEQGKVRLAANTSDYLPWLKNSNNADLARVTIRQLLVHTSGITRDGTEPQWMDDNFPNARKFQRIVLSEPQFFRPGKRFKYSNVGFSLLGAVIESVSGQSYDEYMRKHIFEPLNLEQTDTSVSSRNRKHHAVGYGKFVPMEGRARLPKIADAKSMRAATGLSSNVPDLAKFISSQFAGNNVLLTSKSKREMHTTQYRDKKGYERGYGFEHWKREGLTMVGHSGGYSGFSTRMEFNPKKKYGVIVLTNGLNAWAKSITGGITNILKAFGDTKAKANPRLKEYAGLYGSRWGNDLVVPLGHSLTWIDPASFRPFVNAIKSPRIKSDDFRIGEGDGHYHIGELAHFNRKGKKIVGFTFGSDPSERMILPIPFTNKLTTKG